MRHQELYVSDLYAERFKLLKPVWEDQIFDLLAAKNKGAGAPTLTAIPGSTDLIAQGFTTGNDENLYFSIQTPHQSPYASYTSTYDPQGDTDPHIGLHIHWMPADANAGNVRWEYEYMISVRGTGLRDEVVGAVVDACPGAVSEVITNLVDIPLTYVGDSSIILVRITRKGSHATDTYSGTALGLSVDAHVLRDSLGSVSEFGDE